MGLIHTPHHPDILALECPACMEALAASATCRECGCTEEAPCISEEFGRPCSWAESDLCSACAESISE